MATFTIPTALLPNQVIDVILSSQRCRIELSQKSTGMFCNLYANDALIAGGVICDVGNEIVRSAYQGFTGNIAFFDTQLGQPPIVPGTSPDGVHYLGFGPTGRYFLAYDDGAA